MYRQIQVHPFDRDLQRILWYNEVGEVIDYTLNTVTYGMGPSSFLAVRTILQLAIDERETYPIAAEVFENDSYMDDIHSGADSTDTAAELVSQFDALAKRGGFTLRKWASNDPSALQVVSNEDNVEFKLIHSDEISALGLIWRPNEDEFIVAGLPESTKPITKRVVLSESSRLFDPLGLLAPVIVVAKLILKRIWNCGSNWDDPLNEDLEHDWLTYRNALQSLCVPIPRLVVTSRRVELHGFCDASVKDYAACIYLRSLHSDGSVDVRLLCAKTRVAPVNCDNVPRLELLGALLLARLVAEVQKSFDTPIDVTCMWSDNTIVLSWLSKSPSSWKQFVANRVREIQQIVPTSCWRYVKSADNLADIASRGVLPNEISSLALWWNGPTFLHKPFVMPESESFVDDLAMAEARRQKIATRRINVESHPLLNLIDKRSSVKKIIRITAYCLRFIQNLRVPINLHCKEPSHPLSVDELNQAQIIVVKTVQEDGFPTELRKLNSKGTVGKRSSLLSLNPMLDENGLIRVGGRLAHAPLSTQQRHPLILPVRHPFSVCVVREVHVKEMYAPTNLLISTVRNEYWVVALKSLARCVVHDCAICRRTNSRVCQQIMGNLPSIRVAEPEFPFQHVGLDFGGPIIVKLGTPRSKVTSKAYICLFICLATKAVHLDTATGLDTNSFIAALERSVSRRGLPETITSDNGTNFQGAANELERLCTSNLVQTHLAENRIRWIFIPPSSPHFGGIWEAAVKSTKYHLKRAIGETVLSLEQLFTILPKIEACLNSRPLYEPSDYPRDGPPLTAAHFLIGRPFNCIPQPVVPTTVNNRDKFEQIRRIVQGFWSKWSKEYIHKLQERSKWKNVAKNVLVDDIVVIKEVDERPEKWKLGRIVKVYPGSDNLVHVVDVRTSSGILKCPITKLIVLVHREN